MCVNTLVCGFSGFVELLVSRGFQENSDLRRVAEPGAMSQVGEAAE